MQHFLVAAAIAAITLLGMFVFPGHTWLQSDTQIYAPMLEKLWDPSLYAKELINSRPHLAFTIYDETALLLRWFTRLEFRYALLLEQILFRGLAAWGIYLIARRFTTRVTALFIAGVVCLGATISGPAVVSFEYEPVPRGFALALLLCAIGLVVQGHYAWSAVAASIAFLYHAPTTIPFWILFAVIVFRTRESGKRPARLRVLLPPFAAVALLVIVSRLQPGVTEAQPFFLRIDPEWEALQRVRAPYNWVSLWPAEFFWHYVVLWLLSLAALWRLKPDWTFRVLFLGLPLIGMLSMPASWLLLERMKWSLMPQVQPARAVLFITLCATILTCLSAAEAAKRGRRAETFAWLLLPFLLPVHRMLFQLPWPPEHIALILGLAAFGTAAMLMPAWSAGLAAVFFLIPSLGKISNYSTTLHTPALENVAAWARETTAKDAVFLLPEAGRDLTPGIFRAEALRAVYVDWKAGGQVNYFRDLGMEWWSRWQAVNIRHEIPAEVDFTIYKRDARSHDAAVFQNDGYVVVRTARQSRRAQ